MIDIKPRVHTRNNVRWTTLKKASTELDILEVLNGSDIEDLPCMLTDEIGVDCIDADILHVISEELGGGDAEDAYQHTWREHGMQRGGTKLIL